MKETPSTSPNVRRLAIEVRGVVQGVGFRPFVFRLASDLRLGGWVRNSSQGVFIEAEEVALFPIESMPFSVNRGQVEVVHIRGRGLVKPAIDVSAGAGA